MKITIYEYFSFAYLVFLFAIEYWWGIDFNVEKKAISFIVISLLLVIFLFKNFGNYWILLPLSYVYKFPLLIIPIILLGSLLFFIGLNLLFLFRSIFGYPGDVWALNIVGFLLSLIIGNEIRKTKNYIPHSFFGINFLGNEAYRKSDYEKGILILVILIMLWGINLMSLTDVVYENYIECFLENLGLFRFLDAQGIYIDRSQCYVIFFPHY